MWWISVGTFVLLDLQIWGSLIDVDYHKGHFNEVPMTFRHASSIIIFMTGLLCWRTFQRKRTQAGAFKKS